ncbi:hypothetical protein HA052_26310 [Chromobacterium haemolyticum]|uniref:Uncharacterized protein n=1 Tax=Chromobacterium fluminis TaxID=3044269 RepID=A0ABX0LD47_9NEIS|nr:hypothetical protein [Chromobacterium haemolyticum]NHR08705.1 hypothetical protein [Chromobacterium haemolyticum]
MASPLPLVNKPGRRTLFMSVKNLFTICCASAGWIEMGVKTKLKMLMYHEYIPLFRLFSPCLALAREIVNTFQEPLKRRHKNRLAQDARPERQQRRKS